MKKVWSRLKMGTENDRDQGDLANWIGEQDPNTGYQENEMEYSDQTETYVDNRPIEPQGRKLSRPGIIKWIIFLVFITYMLISLYHAPILKGIGKYLVVQHPPKKSDLIVCMMGKPVERGLEAAELYKRGFAPRIFVVREELPDGYAVLEAKKVHYPESKNLLIMMLQGLGVARSDCIVSDRFVDNTFDEANVVKALIQKNGYHSLIVVTSPTHARRTLLTFKNVFEKDDVQVMVIPSRYSDFRPDDWWKKRKYIREVIIEYQKLICYALRYYF